MNNHTFSLHSSRAFCLAATVVLVAVTNSIAQESKFQSIELKDGKTIEFAVIVPKDFDKSKRYPVLLVLPPGAQNRQMVEAGLNLYWKQGAAEHGWIVISPAAPEGTFFTAGSENLIPEFLDEIKKTWQPIGNKFYLAGVSNGGTSAFRIAGKFPDRFHSLMVMPGFPLTAEDRKRLSKLKKMPIAMYVGENDSSWVQPMKATAAKLKELGADATLEVVAGADHVIQGWQDGKKVFAVLNKWRELVGESEVETTSGK